VGAGPTRALAPAGGRQGRPRTPRTHCVRRPARARTLRAVPQIAVCGCGPQPACRPGRPTPRSNASKCGSARGLRQDPTFVCESGGRQPACPLGLSLAGQESVRRQTRAREQCSRSAETVPRGAGNRLDASRARPPCDKWRPAAAPHASSVADASHTDTSDSGPPPVGCRAPPSLRNRGPETDPRVGGLPQGHKSEYREACHCHRATAWLATPPVGLGHRATGGCQPPLHAPLTHVSAYDAQTVHLMRPTNGCPTTSLSHSLLRGTRSLSVQCPGKSRDRPLVMTPARSAFTE